MKKCRQSFTYLIFDKVFEFYKIIIFAQPQHGMCSFTTNHMGTHSGYSICNAWLGIETFISAFINGHPSFKNIKLLTKYLKYGEAIILLM